MKSKNEKMMEAQIKRLKYYFGNVALEKLVDSIIESDKRQDDVIASCKAEISDLRSSINEKDLAYNELLGECKNSDEVASDMSKKIISFDTSTQNKIIKTVLDKVVTFRKEVVSNAKDELNEAERIYNQEMSGKQELHIIGENFANSL